MRVLGIDPGIAITGYGIVEEKGSRLEALDYGGIVTKATLPFPQRLEKIFTGIREIILFYHPDIMAIEEVFFGKNVKTAFIIGEARGVAILAAVNSGLDIVEYTPLQVKQAVVGYGRADKEQVKQMVRRLLGLQSAPPLDDAADALGVAICHLHSATMLDKLKTGDRNRV